MNEELLNNEQTASIIHNAFKFLERKDIITEANCKSINCYKTPDYLTKKHKNFDICEIYLNDASKLIIVYLVSNSQDYSRRFCNIQDEKLLKLFNETYERLKKEDKVNYDFVNSMNTIIMEQNYSDNDEYSDGSIEKAYEQAENVIKEITLDYTIKHDKDKPKLSQVPKEALEAVAEVMAYGTDKYGNGTWNRVEVQRYIDALARHLYAMQDIDENGREYINLAKKDDESGIEHLYRLLCNAAYAAALYKRNQGNIK